MANVIKFDSMENMTVGDFVALQMATLGQEGFVLLNRICDVCNHGVGNTEVKSYKCETCQTHFDVAHDCKVDRTDLCPSGYGCNATKGQ